MFRRLKSHSGCYGRWRDRDFNPCPAARGPPAHHVVPVPQFLDEAGSGVQYDVRLVLHGHRVVEADQVAGEDGEGGDQAGMRLAQAAGDGDRRRHGAAQQGACLEQADA